MHIVLPSTFTQLRLAVVAGLTGAVALELLAGVLLTGREVGER